MPTPPPARCAGTTSPTPSSTSTGRPAGTGGAGGSTEGSGTGRLQGRLRHRGRHGSRHQRPQGRGGQVTAVRPELSVVVMGYRDEGSIVAAVRSVLDQVGDERVEVVAVTSGGDASAALVQRAFPGLPVIESAER